MKQTSFLLSFQESCSTDGDVLSPVAGTRTMTEAREEDDQDRERNFEVGTRTATRTREEDDQDNILLAATKTATAVREESDQDQNSNASASTKTRTFTREEDDQDERPRSYFAFPRS